MLSNALIMGVVNVTPDSFSDGGRFNSPDAALAKCLALIEDGADVVDIGAESTRPGAKAITEAEEWQRLEPVLKPLVELKKSKRFQISVDTYKPGVMLRAAKLGVDMVNNVSGLADAETLRSLSQFGNLSYVCMHMHLEPETMQKSPLVGNQGVLEVAAFFKRATTALTAAGFSKDRLFMDPGIGFGKDDRANFLLLKETAQFAKDYQMCIGVSRKGFIGRLLGIPEAKDRDGASKMLEISQIFAGARMIRTHDVKTLSQLR